MLFILTGDVRIGKTRWLTILADNLERAGVPCAGVLAPGVWKESAVSDGSIEREKIGIDNVLLPEGERVSFAVRRDLLENDSASTSQSESAQLAWAIADQAIARVNEHFERLDQASSCGAADTASGDGAFKPGLLVVDELGRLELMYNRGLENALSLLDRGPTQRWPHALIIVRDWLLEAALERFAPVWGTGTVIGPDEAGRGKVLTAFDL